MVEEYLTATAGRNLPTGTKQDNKRNAAMFLQRTLLQDFRPPWLTYTFPQTLPCDSVLSR